MKKVSDEELEVFCTKILSTKGNPWYHTKYIDIYIRNPELHLIHGERTEFLGIPSLEIKDKFKGQGIFMRMLDILEPQINIFVENVFNSDLERSLETRDYVVSGEYPKCFYKMINKV